MESSSSCRRSRLAQALLVGRVGVEPTLPEETDFKSVASANSATAPGPLILI